MRGVLSAMDATNREEEASAADRLRRLWRIHPPVGEAEANAALKAHHPSWHLTLDGCIVAANSLALWLWGGADAGRAAGVPDPATLLGANVFDVLAQNLRRIPTERNRDFLAKTAWIEKTIGGTTDTSLFQGAMLADPDLRRIYEGAAHGIDGNAWEYDLCIAPPEAAANDHLLEFRTTVWAVARGGEPLGYAANYLSLRETEQVVEKQYAALRVGGLGHSYVFRFNLERRRVAAAWRSGTAAESVSAPEAEPQVTLYADDSAAGRTAAAALVEVGIPFRSLSAAAGGGVAAEFGGLRFEGPDGVRELAQGLREMRGAFARRLGQAHPHLFRT
jgi:hypothetical protein